MKATKKHYCNNSEHTPLLLSPSHKKDEESWIPSSSLPSSSSNKKSSCTFNLLISIIIPSLSGFLFGYDKIVVESILSLPNFQHHYFNSKNKVIFMDPFDYLDTGFYSMAILGTIFSYFICDFAGRKRTLIGSYFILCMGTLLYTCFIHSSIFLIGRMIIGFAFGILLVVSPIMIAELAPSDIRGCLVGFLTLFTLAGNLSGYYIMNVLKPNMSASLISSNDNDSHHHQQENHHSTSNHHHYHFISGGITSLQNDWRSPLLLEAFFVFFMALAQYHLYDSPRWIALLYQQKLKEQQHDHSSLDHIYSQGLQAVAFLNEKKVDDLIVRQTWKQLSHSALYLNQTDNDDEDANNNNMIKNVIDLIKKKDKLILTACLFMVANYMTGFEVIVKYYASDIFYAAGLPTYFIGGGGINHHTPSLLSTPGCIQSILMASTAVSLGWFVDNINRKMFLMFGSMMIAMCHICIGFILYSFTIMDLQTGTIMIINTHASTLLSASVYILFVSYSFTWGPLLLVTVLEWFSTLYRVKSFAIIMSIYWLGQWLMLVSSPWHFLISFSLMFFIYGLSTLATCYFIYRCVPNTTKLSLENISDC
ncbi:unnamed protein product [Cunninghamella blakesleeana]